VCDQSPKNTAQAGGPQLRHVSQDHPLSAALSSPPVGWRCGRRSGGGWPAQSTPMWFVGWPTAASWGAEIGAPIAVAIDAALVKRDRRDSIGNPPRIRSSRVYAGQRDRHNSTPGNSRRKWWDVTKPTS